MKRAALFVGINDYNNPLSSLKCARPDADTLYALFLPHYTPGMVEYLHDVDDNDIIESVENIMRKLEPGDLFFFYFAGHGVEEHGKHFLLSSKARLMGDEWDKALSVSKLKHLTQKNGVQTVIVIDSCRESICCGARTVTAAEPARGVTLKKLVNEEAVNADYLPPVIICSCSSGQQSFEKDGHGIFTHALKECLLTRQYFSVDEIVSNVAGRMTALVAKHNLSGKQTPELCKAPLCNPLLWSADYAGAAVAPAPDKKEKSSKRTTWLSLDDEQKYYLLSAQIEKQVANDADLQQEFSAVTSRFVAGDQCGAYETLQALSVNIEQKNLIKSYEEKLQVLSASYPADIMVKYPEEATSYNAKWKVVSNRLQTKRVSEDLNKFLDEMEAIQKRVIAAEAEAEAKRKAAEEALLKVLLEAKSKAEEEAKRKAAEEAKRKAEAEAEAKRKAKIEAERIRKAEEEAERIRKAEEETKSFTEISCNGVKLELVKIPAGTFMMGSPKNELGRCDDEKQHQVTLTKDYWLGKYQVTQAQWKAVMGNNPSDFKGDNRPVENVSWNDARVFCEKLNSLYAEKLPRGYKFDLPTEAQWEYACRAGTKTALNNGKNLTDDTEGNCDNLAEVAWYNDSETHPVGQNLSNAWGLYDMHGNVEEWCRDWYGDYSNYAVTDPEGPLGGVYRLRRGGSWCSTAECCRSADRRGYSRPGWGFNHIGFRLALVPNFSLNKKQLKCFAELSDTDFYLTPNIPSAKLTNARNTYAPNVNSQDVLALYDDTVFGGAREGLILTKDCIYSHEISCDPVKVKFGKDSYIRCLKKDIYVNDVKACHLCTASEEFVTKLAACIRELAKLQ